VEVWGQDWGDRTGRGGKDSREKVLSGADTHKLRSLDKTRKQAWAVRAGVKKGFPKSVDSEEWLAQGEFRRKV